MRDVIINLLAWVVAPIATLVVAVVAVVGLAELIGSLAHMSAVVALVLCSWWFFRSGRGHGRLLFVLGCTLSAGALVCAAYIGGAL